MKKRKNPSPSENQTPIVASDSGRLTDVADHTYCALELLAASHVVSNITILLSALVQISLGMLCCDLQEIFLCFSGTGRL